jgi:conjugal transfer pilus assembly protein TraW
MKQISRAVFLVILLLSDPLLGKHFPPQGHTFDIAEENFLLVIQRRLLTLHQEGRLKVLDETFKKRIKARALRPLPVSGVSPTTKVRRFIYDPSFRLDHDIRDEKGGLIHPKGTQVNPLDTLRWGDPLLLIQGDDPRQVHWALQQRGKITLVDGSPLSLMDRHKRRFYFDQGGFIVKKFSIQQVPARIVQAGRVLRVEELKP